MKGKVNELKTQMDLIKVALRFLNMFEKHFNY